MRRVVELDGLRAIAVMLVVLSHVSELPLAEFPRPIEILFDGSLGVLIFFVLSGFLITTILKSEHEKTGHISVASFYARRAFRIIPASYAYIAAISVLAWLKIANVSLAELLTATLHFWNYSVFLVPATDPEQGKIVLGHFWSLALEEQFYWFLPTALLLFRKRISSALLAIVIFLPLVRIGSYVEFPETRGQLSMMLHTAIDPMCIGALFALERNRLPRFLIQPKQSIFFLNVLFLLAIVPVLHYFLKGAWSITFGRTIEGLSAAILIVALANQAPALAKRILASLPFQYIGKISYSLYLWQQLYCVKGTVFETSPIKAVVLAIGTASLSYLVIERPFLNLKNHFERK